MAENGLDEPAIAMTFQEELATVVTERSEIGNLFGLRLSSFRAVDEIA